MSEAQHQAALFRWATMRQMQAPELRLMFHVPNGGARHKLTAWKLKQEGVKPGVPDVCLPVPRGGFHGLWVELKNDKPKGALSADQRQWLAELAGQGYATKVAYGWEDAAEAISGYLGLTA